MNKSELTAAVIARAKAFDADLIAIGGAERFRDTCAGKILPGLKSVICIAFRVLRGSRRGIEEGTTFYGVSAGDTIYVQVFGYGESDYTINLAPSL